MNRYDPNIHQRRSIRLKGYDYSQAGLYFITICCQDRIYRFGNVVNGEMILNEYGQIAYDEWLKTPEVRPNVQLGEFIIMPNHIHGIIRLVGRWANRIRPSIRTNSIRPNGKRANPIRPKACGRHRKPLAPLFEGINHRLPDNWV